MCGASDDNQHPARGRSSREVQAEIVRTLCNAAESDRKDAAARDRRMVQQTLAEMDKVLKGGR